MLKRCKSCIIICENHLQHRSSLARLNTQTQRFPSDNLSSCRGRHGEGVEVKQPEAITTSPAVRRRTAHACLHAWSQQAAPACYGAAVVFDCRMSNVILVQGSHRRDSMGTGRRGQACRNHADYPCRAKRVVAGTLRPLPSRPPLPRREVAPL